MKLLDKEVQVILFSDQLAVITEDILKIHLFLSSH